MEGVERGVGEGEVGGVKRKGMRGKQEEVVGKAKTLEGGVRGVKRWRGRQT